MSGKNSIQVAIKVRPLLKKEKDQQPLWRVVNNSIQQADSQTDPYYFGKSRTGRDVNIFGGSSDVRQKRQTDRQMMMIVICIPDQQFHTAGRFTNRSQLFWQSRNGMEIFLVGHQTFARKTTDGHMMRVLCMLLDISLGCRPIFMFINKPKHPHCTTTTKNILSSSHQMHKKLSLSVHLNELIQSQLA